MWGSLDVALPDGTGDAQYLSKLRNAIDLIANNFLPDIVIYDAGVDVHLNDRLGRLNITSDGIMARDLLVLSFFQAIRDGSTVTRCVIMTGAWGSFS